MPKYIEHIWHEPTLTGCDASVSLNPRVLDQGYVPKLPDSNAGSAERLSIACTGDAKRPEPD